MNEELYNSTIKDLKFNYFIHLSLYAIIILFNFGLIIKIY